MHERHVRPREFLRTNTHGTFELLEAARTQLARLGDEERRRFRFLHVSTDEVYGSLGPDGAFTEDTPYAPNSPYAATKAAADHLVRAWHATFGVPTILTNCSNNYGPYQFPEKLIPLMILNAMEGKPLPVYGDGRNVRDWLFVEDHCAGIMLALLAGHPGEKYNIGGRSEKTNLEILSLLCGALERELPAASNPALSAHGFVRYDDLKTFVPDRQGHDRRYAIDPTKIERELGWRAQHDLAAGIAATVRWYVANRAWCHAVQAQGNYQRQRLGVSPERREESR